MSNNLLTAFVLICVGLGIFTLSFLFSPKSREGIDEKNLTYTIAGQNVTLVDGYAETPAAPGSASRIITRYFGNQVKADIDRNNIPDTVFLITQDGGGSGTFFYLVAALLQPDGTYKGSTATLIGDRIAPQTTEYRDGLVIVNYTDRKPGEPMTAPPSEGKSLYLKYSADTMDFGEVVQDFEGEVGTNAPVLDLSGRGLTEVSGDVFNRTELQHLDLSHNNLIGALPAEIRHLQNLKVLDLSNNKFTGVPAEVGQLKNLEILNLSNNQLTGLPREIGNLSKLRVLDISGNAYSAADLEIIRTSLPQSTQIKTQ